MYNVLRVGVTSGLFREEAIAAQQGQWLGTIRIGRPISFSIVAVVAMALALALVLFGLRGEITRKARLSGLLMPIAGTFNLVAPQAGVLRKLFVKEGDSVLSGQLLAVLSTDRTTTEGELTQLVSRTLDDRRTSLETERRLIERQAKERSDALRDRLRNLEAERAQAATELDAAQRRVDFAKTTVERYRQLAIDGFVAEIQVQQKQEELLDLEAREGGVRRALVTSAGESLVLKAEQKATTTTLETQRAQFEGSLAALAREAAENGARGHVSIISPRDAIVSAVSSNIGETVQVGRSVLTLVPREGQSSGELEAQLYSPSRTAGFVVQGQSVWLRVNAYPHEKFGLVEGRVKSISHTPIIAQDLPQGQAQALSEAARSAEPLFRVDVSLGKQGIVAYGQAQAFKAGMSVQADVIQDRRAVWEWMLEPVLAASGNMRVILGSPQSPTSHP